VSAPPVRNQVAPGTSHSSTSSNSARTTSLATPRTLSSYTLRRFVTSPAFRGWRSGPLSAAGAARASPTDHPRQGESGGACSRECGVPGRPAGSLIGPKKACPTQRQLIAVRRPTQPECSVLPVPEARVRWQAAGAPGGSPPASARPASSSNGPPRQARRLPGCLDPFGIFRHARWPPAPPDPGWDVFRAGAVVALYTRLAPRGSPVRLSGCCGHSGWLPVAGVLGPELPGRWLTARREKTRAPSPIRPCRESVAGEPG
jgi:hypothetical protein